MDKIYNIDDANTCKIKEIAEFICDLKGISLEDLATITNHNIKRIFDI